MSKSANKAVTQYYNSIITVNLHSILYGSMYGRDQIGMPVSHYHLTCSGCVCIYCMYMTRPII